MRLWQMLEMIKLKQRAELPCFDKKGLGLDKLHETTFETRF